MDTYQETSGSAAPVKPVDQPDDKVEVTRQHPTADDLTGCQCVDYYQYGVHYPSGGGQGGKVHQNL